MNAKYWLMGLLLAAAVTVGGCTRVYIAGGGVERVEVHVPFRATFSTIAVENTAEDIAVTLIFITGQRIELEPGTRMEVTLPVGANHIGVEVYSYRTFRYRHGVFPYKVPIVGDRALIIDRDKIGRIAQQGGRWEGW
jgi:hypothetical protein